MNRNARVLIALGCLGWVAARVAAAAGDLDPAFGDNGFARIESGLPAGLFVQSDGKLLVGSGRGAGTEDFVVWRLELDGTPDATFDGDGRASLDDGAAAGWTSAVIQQLDGNVVVAGRYTTDAGATSDLALARYLTDGRLDMTFGMNGLSRAGLVSTVIETVAIVQQSDGKLVLAGTGHSDDASSGAWDYQTAPGAGTRSASAESQIFLVRFDAAGTLDPGFGGVWIDPSGTRESGIESIAQQADGKLVGAGFSGADLALFRLTVDGALDASFDGDGIVTVATLSPDAMSWAGAVDVDSDGKIVVAGTVASACAASNAACRTETSVVRLNPDGSLDASFGTDGRAAVSLSGWSRTEASTGGLAIAPTGEILVAGRAGRRSGDPYGPTYGFVARVAPSGVLDPSFGAGGITLLDAGQYSPPRTELRGMALFADGSVATSMSADGQYGGDSMLIVARLAGSGGSPGTISLANVQVAAPEGSEADFLVQRTGGSAGSVSVAYQTFLCWDWFSCADTASDDDYVAQEGTLTWAEGDTQDRTITIPVVADNVTEPLETFSFSLSQESGATLGAAYGWVEILDFIDAPGAIRVDSGTFVSEAARQAVLWVSRIEGNAGAVTVDYSTAAITAAANVDFTPVSGTLRWADGDSAAKSISIPIINDGVAEADETFQVIVSNPTGGATPGSSVALVTIRDAPSATGAVGGGGAVSVLEAMFLSVMLLAAAIIRCRVIPAGSPMAVARPLHRDRTISMQS